MQIGNKITNVEYAKYSLMEKIQFNCISLKCRLYIIFIGTDHVFVS